MKRRVVITGMGAVTPIGNDVPGFWDGLRQGVCGVGPITLYDTSAQKIHIAAEIKNWHVDDILDPKESRKMDRVTQVGMAAAKEAMQDWGGDLSKTNCTRFGVAVSSGIGGFATIQQEHSKGLTKGFDRVSPHFIPMVIANIPAGSIAIAYGLKGMCSAVVTACAGGTNAIGESFRHIRDGYAELMLCGGTEACITPLAMGGFTSMKALNDSNQANRSSIPFDKERKGFVMGEGAGLLVLEELECAKARGAHIYAEIVGYGSTCDAYHVTAPAPGGEGAARCMSAAIADAGIKPEDIQYINAHGTSTEMNDVLETMAVKDVFGSAAYSLAMSSTKSMTGHLLGASGGVEAIACIKAIEQGFLPATINYQVPDAECDLDIIPNIGRAQQVEYAMSNSFGFGGHNATVIFRKYQED